MQGRIRDVRKRIDDRRSIHPQADEEGKQQLQVAVLGRHTGEEDTEAERQAGEHHYQEWNQQRIPVGMNLHIGEDLVVGIDGKEERKLDAKTHEVAHGITQGGDETREIDLAEDTCVGNEGVAGLVQTVGEILPEADTCQVEKRLGKSVGTNLGNPAEDYHIHDGGHQRLDDIPKRS